MEPPFTPDLFCIGAAFMLLETKSVVQFALLFGTTWFVNALVFLGVMLSVLAAVVLSQRVTFKHPARLYLLLLVGLVIAFVVPPSALLSLDPVPRFFAATVIAFLPIFTANLVFAQRFKSTSASATAFTTAGGAPSPGVQTTPEHCSGSPLPLAVLPPPSMFTPATVASAA